MRDAAPAYDPRIAAFLDEVLSACGSLSRLDRDPLAIVRRYEDGADRELAALLCSFLAFGSVDLIMRACDRALAPLGDRPARALGRMGDVEIEEACEGFRYRFCEAADLAFVMLAAKRALEADGSLEGLFLRGDRGGPDVADALGAFVRSLKSLGAEGETRARRRGEGDRREGGLRRGLLPEPADGSACKRLFLFLRWLVREDGVDPGGWRRVDPARLVVPLDVHMARVCSDRLRFIPRPAATMRNALAATAAFRLYAPDDPVKYDFALTRPGIDPEPGDERFGCT